MRELNAIQFQILDSLYFVEPFSTLVQEVNAAEPVIADELKNLITAGFVQAMSFDEKAGDYVQSIFYDSDDMHAFFYLATKEGLLKHNGS